jgi:hypothetical protein
MRDCTVNLVSPGTGALTRNYAAVNPAATASDASITSGQSVITSSLGNVAVAGQSVTVAGAGPGGDVVLTGYVSAQTSNTITITNLDGSALTASATVSSAAISLYTRDSNVHVKGGNWNIPSGLGGVTFANYEIVFGHCDHYSAEIQSLTTASSGRCILQYDTTDGYVDAPNLYGNVIELAGIYAVGPVYGLVVNRATGLTYDDFCCLSGADNVGGVQSSGNVKNIDVRYIYGTSTHDYSVRIVGGASMTMDKINVDYIFGSSAGIYIGDYAADAWMVGGTYGKFNFGHVGQLGTNYAMTLQSPAAEEIRINLAQTAGNGNTSAIYVTGTSVVTISKLIVTGTANMASVVTHGTADVTIGHLVFDHVTFQRPSGSGFLLQVNTSGAVVSVCDVIGCTVSMNTSCDLVQVAIGATLSYLNITGGTCTGTAALYNDTSVATSVITFSGGFECTATQYIAIVVSASGTKQFNFDGCSFPSITTYGIKVTGAAPLTILKGDQIRIGGTPTMINLTASQSVQAVGISLPLDLSQIIRTGVGDLAYNSNSGLSCGTGPCISSGAGSAGSWKNLITGSTY